ncbi:hypothetical protein Dvar_30930 [Desulfosarcina variabilis str. Montpellier]|uniref:hypothetical protein n=1 Tax=Desulfosarcina variabilis TaxID=2300 RepID=UPI003AFAE1F2
MARVTIEPKADNNVRDLIRMAVENELKALRSGIERTSEILSEMEKKYRMSSQEFYDRFDQGEMGDDMDFIRWAGEFETLKQLKRDFGDLSEIEICS